MFTRVLHTCNRLAIRALRPGLATLLVLAQVVASFGFPMVSSETTLRACGCAVEGPSATCCCNSGGCCAKVTEPEPEPVAEEPACPHCKINADEPPRPVKQVTWVNVMKAQQCRGEGPMGLFTDISALPPSIPVTAFVPSPAGFTSTVDLDLTSTTHIPLDPPPRV